MLALCQQKTDTKHSTALITCILKIGGKKEREIDREKKKQESAEAISGLKMTL